MNDKMDDRYSAKYSLFFALLALMVCGCGGNAFYRDIKPVPDEKWNVSQPLTFSVDIPDSSVYYDFYINLRNTTDFETQNFYVFMQTKYPDGHSEQDTLGFILCDKFGKWTGKGKGRIKDNKFLFQPNVRFPFSGTYAFTVTQGMRQETVKGVSDFGITLEKRDK